MSSLAEGRNANFAFSGEEPAGMSGHGGCLAGDGGDGGPAGPEIEVALRAFRLPRADHKKVKGRLDERTDKTPGHGPFRTCWIWRGGGRGEGYGALKINGRVIDTHVLAFMIFHGIERLPSRTDISFSCDVRACVNPAHLHLVSRASNLIDAVAKGRVRIVTPRGEDHHDATLSRQIVAEVRRRWAAGESDEALADEFGVKVRALRRARSGETWRHVVDPPPVSRRTLRRERA